MAMVSAAFGRRPHCHVELVGQRLQRVDHVEVPGVQRRVVRLADHSPAVSSWGRTGRAWSAGEVRHRGFPAHVALAHERAPVDAAKTIWSPPMCTLFAGFLAWSRTRAGLRHLFKNELRSSLTTSPSTSARPCEQLDRLRLGELMPISDTIRRQPRSRTPMASETRLSYLGMR